MGKKGLLKAIGATSLGLTIAAVTTALAFTGKPAPAMRGENGALPQESNAVLQLAKGQGAAQNKAEAKEDERDADNQEKDDDGNLTATITPEQAKAAALAVQPGTVTKVELERENGTTVYGVHITASDGKLYDVKVDATSAKVLKSEADDEDKGKTEGPEGTQEGGENED